LLGRLLPEFFPKIFGPDEKDPLDINATKLAFEELTAKINKENEKNGAKAVDCYEVALGFIKVANETMSRPIRSLT
jgi:5-oxoprolinase (ATP-hydrolysing)